MVMMCSKGGGSAQAAPAPYQQPPAPPPAPPVLPCANQAQGTMGQSCSGKVKAVGAAAMNAKSTSSPTTDQGPMGIGGAISHKLMGSMAFASCGSGKVKIEGAAAARLGDPTNHDDKNNPAAAFIAPSQSKVLVLG